MNEHKEKFDTDGEKFVVFFLGDELFAVRASVISEVMSPPAITPLPKSPAWLIGIANLRGAILSVVNLARLCSKKTTTASPKTKIVVLKPQMRAPTLAFPVDRLTEMVTLTPQDIKPAPDARLLGKAFYRSSSVSLLDTEKLFSALS